ncbi:hypothetical protein [Marinobacter gelidimuriae]|uniref:hypothetical protein n=1 Tax=Marinobacter gelidimuriae TaxID=2739064 RepID=UPI0003766FB1|nr:hypothetical protein [Marinobacter gelidimuriae]
MGTNSMSELSQKLETKQAQARERIEKHTLSELKRHARSLRDGLNDELATTKSDISDRLNQITELIENLERSAKQGSASMKKSLSADLNAIRQSSNENRQAAMNTLKWGWLKYSLPALAVLAIILGANWGLMQWQSSRLIAMQEQIDQAQRTLNQLPQGVRFAQDGQGKSFLIYENEPQIFQTQSGGWATELKTR